MSGVLDRMKTTLERKRKQLQELQADVAGFERVIAYYENHQNEIDIRVSTPDEVKSAVEEMLRLARKPMHYKNEIYPNLALSGIEVAGQDPARNLGAYLSGDNERFKSFGEGMWGLVEWESQPPKEGSSRPYHREIPPPTSQNSNGLRQSHDSQSNSVRAG